MDTTLFISFVVVSVALIVIPGPNVLVIVSTGIAHGRLRGLQTVAGTTLAMAIQLVVAAFATAWFVSQLAAGFYYLKWLGAIYLLYLATLHLKHALAKEATAFTPSAKATFARGFWVSLSNPKTILFFSAFLPQFVNPGNAYLLQISILSFTFLLLAALLDSCYALLSGRLQTLIQQRNLSKLQNGVSAVLFFGASAWLATTRRSMNGPWSYR